LVRPGIAHNCLQLANAGRFTHGSKSGKRDLCSEVQRSALLALPETLLAMLHRGTIKLPPEAMPVEISHHVRGEGEGEAGGKDLLPHLLADAGSDVFWQSLIFGQPNKPTWQQSLSVLMHSSHNILNQEAS